MRIKFNGLHNTCRLGHFRRSCSAPPSRAAKDASHKYICYETGSALKLLCSLRPRRCCVCPCARTAFTVGVLNPEATTGAHKHLNTAIGSLSWPDYRAAMHYWQEGTAGSVTCSASPPHATTKAARTEIVCYVPRSVLNVLRSVTSGKCSTLQVV